MDNITEFNLEKEFNSMMEYAENIRVEKLKKETLRKHLISENKNNVKNYKIPKSTIKKDKLQIGSYKFKQNKRK